jgi:hypothetical protein
MRIVNFREYLFPDVGCIESPVVLPRGLCRLSPIEATAATSDTTLEGPPAKLLREPLFWASVAAVVGVVVGLAGTFSMAGWLVVWRGPGGHILEALSLLLGVPGYFLAVLSLLGVPILLGWCSRALRIGTALLLASLLLWLAVQFAPMLFPLLWTPKGLPSLVFTVALWATVLLGSAVVLSLGLGAFFAGARKLGAVLLVLGVPGDLLFYSAHNALTGTTEISTHLAVTTTLLFGADLGVAEACLFTLLGAILLSGAGGRLRRRSACRGRRTARKPCDSTRWALPRTIPRCWRRSSPISYVTPDAAQLR